MAPWVAVLIVLGAAAVAALAFALVHRRARAPLLMEPSRGTSMVTVTGTLFAVVLAFVTLAAFQTYGGARTGAQSEAEAVLNMARAAALFPPAQRYALRADLVCYGRAVVDQEWPAMAEGHSSPLVDYWINAYRGLFRRFDLGSPRERLAFQELLSLTETRTSGRQQRLNDDTQAVPTPLWVALIFAGCVVVALQLAMTDPRERLSVQGLLVAGLAGVVAAGLLIVYFLDHPYQRHAGDIQPSAMRNTLVMLQDLERGLPVPCSQTGRPA
jgi:protein-S-isoprenylcysteine O-methyltransferase Ste14